MVVAAVALAQSVERVTQVQSILMVLVVMVVLGYQVVSQGVLYFMPEAGVALAAIM